MSRKSYLGAFCLSGLALTLSACSMGGYTDADFYDDSSSAYYAGNGGGAHMGHPAGCMGEQGFAGGSTRYGEPSLRSYGGGTVQKSRYESYETSANMQQAGCGGGGGGYYMIPTYQVIQQPAALPAPAPVMTVPSITIEETTCPTGQYKMTNGDCAIMQTEQYEPPVISGYVEPVRTPIEYYDPIRK